MSSLEACTEKLLAQKAIQGSHYEHIAHQLTELHRNERNASITLKSLISDVERRLCDYEDVRLSSAELTKQLMQDKLKLQALMLTINESSRVKHEVMQVFSECTEQWSTIPAELVQLLRILAERKQCVLVAKEFTSQLCATKVIFFISHDTIKVHRLVERGIYGQVVQWTYANNELTSQCTIITTSVKSSLETATHRMRSVLQSCHAEQINVEQELFHVEEANSVELIKHDGLRQRGDLARQYVRELLQCVEQSACTVTHMQEKFAAAQKAAQQLRESANAQAAVHAHAEQKRNDELQRWKEKLLHVHIANCNMAEQTKSLQSAILLNQTVIRSKQKEVYVLEWMTRLLTTLHNRIADDKHKASNLEEKATMTEMDWKHKQEIALESIRMARYQSQCQEAVEALMAEESLTRRAMCVEEVDKRKWCASEYMKTETELRQREKMETEMYIKKKKKKEEQELDKQRQQKWKVELHHPDKDRKRASKRNRAIVSQLNESALRQHESFYNNNNNNNGNNSNNNNHYKNTKSAKVEIAKFTTCPFLAGTASSIATSHSATTIATTNTTKFVNYSNLNNNNNNNNITQTSKRPRSTIITKRTVTKTDKTNQHKFQTTHTQSVPSPSPLPRRPYHIPLSQQDPFSSLSSVIIPFPANSLTQTHQEQTQQMNKQEPVTQENSHMDEEVGAADVIMHNTQNEELQKLIYVSENKQSHAMAGQNISVALNKRNNHNKSNHFNDIKNSEISENEEDEEDDDDDSDNDTNSMASAVSVLSAALSTLKNVTTATITAVDAVEKDKQKKDNLLSTNQTYHGSVREDAMSKQKTETNNNDNTLNDKHVRFDEQKQKQKQKQQQRHYYNNSQNVAQRYCQGNVQSNAPKLLNANVHLPLSPSPSPSPSTSPSSPVLSDLTPALLVRNRPHNRSNRPLALPQLPAKEMQWHMKVHAHHKKFIPSINSETSTTVRTTATADNNNEDEFVHVVNIKSNIQDKLHTAIPAKRPVRPSRIKMTRTEKADNGKLTQSHRKNDINCSDDIFADIYSEKTLEL